MEDKRKADEILSETAAKTEEILKPKKKRGGPRPGAGRKPNYLKRSGVPAVLAHQILACHDIFRLWSDLLNSKNEHVKLQALVYLTNREQGMPKFQGEMKTTNESFSAVKILFVEPGKSAPPKELPAPPVEVTFRPQPEVLPPAGAADPTPLPQVECSVHGRYTLPSYGAPQICPTCKAESERYEAKLQSLTPGGGWN